MGTDYHSSNEVKRPEIHVNKCQGSSCKTDQEINEFLANKELQVIVLSKSYNTTNYNYEEKLQRVATRYAMKFKKDQFRDVLIKSSSESLETEDEFYSLGLISDTQKFYSVP